MRNLLAWIKRHLTAFGCVFMALSACGFAIIYKVNQSRPPGEVSVTESSVYIALQSAPVGVWIVLSICIGSAGIILVGYSMLKRRDAKDALDKGFEKLLKRK